MAEEAGELDSALWLLPLVEAENELRVVASHMSEVCDAAHSTARSEGRKPATVRCASRFVASSCSTSKLTRSMSTMKASTSQTNTQNCSLTEDVLCCALYGALGSTSMAFCVLLDLW